MTEDRGQKADDRRRMIDTEDGWQMTMGRGQRAEGRG